MLDQIRQNPLLISLIGIAVVILAAAVSYLIGRRVIVGLIDRVVRRTSSDWDDTLQEHRVFERLASLAPALAVYYGAQFVPGLSEDLQLLVQRVATALMISVALASASAFLSAVNDIYSRYPIARTRPIKGYLQVLKILIFLLGGIVVVSLLINRSPLLFLSGIGALTAVLLLVFKDTILSLVASVQIASNDMVRVGDWIEMPQLQADGDVVDIALHTVKVQNWDKTVTTIPTYKLIQDSFKNWRGMSLSGGRRIKRAINIDLQTIRFLSEEELDRFERFEVLQSYIREKREELTSHNAGKDPSVVANTRNLTNIGTFRAYIVGYLKNHPGIHDGMTFLIRQLAPTTTGVPIEVYVFSRDTNWVAYEGLQSDIFDHLLAVVPEFGLRVYQAPSGTDFRSAMSGQG